MGEAARPLVEHNLNPMASLHPFRALRPRPADARRIAAVPYDVVNTDEARAFYIDQTPMRRPASLQEVAAAATRTSRMARLAGLRTRGPGAARSATYWPSLPRS